MKHMNIKHIMQVKQSKHFKSLNYLRYVEKTFESKSNTCPIPSKKDKVDR